MDESRYVPPEGLLPHRPPFLFIDEVLACDAQSARALRTFRPDEDFFRGHFPGRPIVPGVILLESMAQTFAYMALAAAPGVKGVFLTGIDRARFRKPVLPGECVEITVRLEGSRMGLMLGRAEARVGNVKVADARLSGVVENV